MHFKYLQHVAFAATVFDLATAQSNEGIPDDLQAGFKDNTQVQVSYTGDAVNGFKSGTTFEKDAVSEVPTFALGDSSAVAPRNRYTILMIDTTCDNARKLHYARTNFKYNFDVVKIESETTPVLVYKAPGAFQETGDDRKYTFLMYGQPQNKEISDLQLGEEGAVFDVKKFQTDNGFKDPSAGVGMVVKLGGQSSCDGNTTPAQPPAGEESSAAPAPAPPSSAPAPSAAPSATPSAAPSAAPEVPSSVAAPVAPSSAVAIPSAAPPATSAASPNEPETPESSAVGVPQTSAAQAPATPTAPVAVPTTIAGPATNATANIPDAITSTTLLTEPVVGETGTPLSSGEPAQQTTNSAPGLSLNLKDSIFIASLFAVVGLAGW